MPASTGRISLVFLPAVIDVDLSFKKLSVHFDYGGVRR